MKRYEVTAEFWQGYDRIYCVEADHYTNAIEQTERALAGDKDFHHVVETRILRPLPSQKSPTPTPQEHPGVYSPTDTKYWDYMREDIRCYRSISSSALAAAFETIQDKGDHTTSQIAAIAMVLEDAVSRTAAIQGLTA